MNISDGSMNLIDLGSRFGTSNNGSKLQANTPISIYSGMVVKFGATNAKVRFVRKQLSFCMTRLDKSDKDRMKRLAKIVGAKIVNNPESATHIISNKFAATIKLLVALVLNLNIVHISWLNFIDSSTNAATIIPKEGE